MNCKNYHFQELCFSKVSNVRSISESFGKPHLSLILTNQCLTIEEFPIIGFYLYHVTSAGQSSNWTTSGKKQHITDR